MATPSVRPAQLVLLATVARRHFLDGRSKVEIAEEFGVSRFKIARLIDEARERGIVHIEIRHVDGIDVDLSARLQERFQLQHAVVVDTPRDDPADVRQHLGRAAAELLAEVITPEDVLGLAWARSVSAMASALPRLPGVPVVQLTGALSFQARRRELDRPRARRRAGRWRPGLRLLRAVHRSRCRDRARPARAARGRAGLQPVAARHQGRCRRRLLGARRVHALRRRGRARPHRPCVGSGSAPTSRGSSCQPMANPSRPTSPSG